MWPPKATGNKENVVFLLGEHSDGWQNVPFVFQGEFHAMFSPLDQPSVVYQAVNKKNGKRYVGITGRALAKRRHEHVRDALAGKGRGAFAHAIRKYGADGFDWSVLSAHSTGHEAVAEEKRLIRTTSPDYNSTFGGESYRVRVLSADARRRISEANKGRTRRLGMKHSAETKEVLRKLGLRDKDKWLLRSHPGPAASARRVVCINDGLTYDSASAAAAHYGIAKSALIEVCQRNPRRNTAGGLVFRYEGDAHETVADAQALAAKPKKHNRTGVKGVYKYYCEGRDTGRYRAERRVNGKRIRLGIFDTAEEGHAAYMAAGENG